MSSPNHPTSDIEDAFVSNFPDYISTSPDYVPASPGNTSSDSPNNSFGFVSIASPTLLLFHDDPYMKDVQAFYVKESPIPPLAPITPPIVLTLSPVLPPSFSVYTPTPPQIFEIEKSSIKMHVKHHEKQIEDILNYLEELSFHRIEKIKERLVNGWMIIQRDFNELKTELKKVRYLFDKSIFTKIPPKRTSTSAAPTMTQATIRQLVVDSVTVALETQVANMENTENANRNTRPRETHVVKRGNYREFISCQPFYFNGTEGAVGLIR
nr:hypothetical protein [Tanacetum cinerariifolium]GEY56913.1 hypothetical protein [Tanacetum cinerariifolium]